jgi:hypothetical protein
MKLKTLPFLKHKTYLFSFMVVMLGSILSSLPAYSQVDYYYGLNKKGLRLGIGAGAGILMSNWTSDPVTPAGLLSLDYDLNPYFSIGLQGQFGQLKGIDAENKLFYQQTAVTYYGGNLNFKVAVGQFSDFRSRSALTDALKRLYIGVGVGEIYAQVALSKYQQTPKPGIASLTDPNGIAGSYPGYDLTLGKTNPSGTSLYIPISFGTNISLRGFGGSDKFELNPNFQYNMVQNAYFDGYQPSTLDYTPTNGLYFFVKKSPNQAFFLGSINLRYKF